MVIHDPAHKEKLKVDKVISQIPQTLDMWQYQVLQNWGFSPGAFVLNFADTSYPVKTNQGRWINNLINFHIEAITRDEVPAYMYDCDKTAEITTALLWSV